MEALADDVSRQGLQTCQRLEPALQDDDFFVAIHAFDAEDGFRVELADRARDLGWRRH